MTNQVEKDIHKPVHAATNERQSEAVSKRPYERPLNPREKVLLLLWAEANNQANDGSARVAALQTLAQELHKGVSPGFELSDAV